MRSPMNEELVMKQARREGGVGWNRDCPVFCDDECLCNRTKDGRSANKCQYSLLGSERTRKILADKRLTNQMFTTVFSFRKSLTSTGTAETLATTTGTTGTSTAVRTSATSRGVDSSTSQHHRGHKNLGNISRWRDVNNSWDASNSWDAKGTQGSTIAEIEPAGLLPASH